VRGCLSRSATRASRADGACRANARRIVSLSLGAQSVALQLATRSNLCAARVFQGPGCEMPAFVPPSSGTVRTMAKAVGVAPGGAIIVSATQTPAELVQRYCGAVYAHCVTMEYCVHIIAVNVHRWQLRRQRTKLRSHTRQPARAVPQRTSKTPSSLCTVCDDATDDVGSAIDCCLSRNTSCVCVSCLNGFRFVLRRCVITVVCNRFKHSLIRPVTLE
jgi:hypothetical protein